MVMMEKNNKTDSLSERVGYRVIYVEMRSDQTNCSSRQRREKIRMANARFDNARNAHGKDVVNVCRPYGWKTRRVSIYKVGDNSR